MCELKCFTGAWMMLKLVFNPHSVGYSTFILLINIQGNSVPTTIVPTCSTTHLPLGHLNCPKVYSPQNTINWVQYSIKMMTESKEDENHPNQSVSIDLNHQEISFNYDEVLEHIGQLGPYQLRALLVLMMPCFFFGLIIMCYTFTAGIPQYR